MLNSVKLHLPLEDFDSLHRAVDNKKKTVKIDANDLRKLLIDHSVLINQVTDLGVVVIDNDQELKPKTNVEQSHKQTKTKQWKVIDPDGNDQLVDNLTKFSKENGLTASVMSGVANGKYTHHKGWKCIKLG